MAKTVHDAIRNLAERIRNNDGLSTDSIKNTQQVFKKMPKAETKERQKVDFEELFERHSKKIFKGEYIETESIKALKKYFLQYRKFWPDSDDIIRERIESSQDQKKSKELREKLIVLNNPNIFKGLLVFGECGNGKSMFFDIIHSIAKELVINHGYQGLWFTKVTAPWIVEEYMRATEKGYNGTFQFTSYYKGTLYIDDLGAEKLAFGRDNIIADLLFERHKNGVKTFVTTNLTPKQLGELYGFRISDRLPGMFNIIKFKEKSYRE